MSFLEHVVPLKQSLPELFNRQLRRNECTCLHFLVPTVKNRSHLCEARLNGRVQLRDDMCAFRNGVSNDPKLFAIKLCVFFFAGYLEPENSRELV